MNNEIGFGNDQLHAFPGYYIFLLENHGYSKVLAYREVLHPNIQIWQIKIKRIYIELKAKFASPYSFTFKSWRNVVVGLKIKFEIFLFITVYILVTIAMSILINR